MRDMMLNALLPESMSDEAAYHMVYFISNLARTLECIYCNQIKRHARHIEEEFYYPKSDLMEEDPPF
jgi:hypothetical protein